MERQTTHRLAETRSLAIDYIIPGSTPNCIAGAGGPIDDDTKSGYTFIRYCDKLKEFDEQCSFHRPRQNIYFSLLLKYLSTCLLLLSSLNIAPGFFISCTLLDNMDHIFRTTISENWVRIPGMPILNSLVESHPAFLRPMAPVKHAYWSSTNGAAALSKQFPGENKRRRMAGRSHHPNSINVVGNKSLILHSWYCGQNCPIVRSWLRAVEDFFFNIRDYLKTQIYQFHGLKSQSRHRLQVINENAWAFLSLWGGVVLKSIQ